MHLYKITLVNCICIVFIDQILTAPGIFLQIFFNFFSLSGNILGPPSTNTIEDECYQQDVIFEQYGALPHFAHPK